MNIGGRFWLEDKRKAIVGCGRVELLEKIRDTGSINEAAKSMKMAYKAAWDAVDAINRVASQPVAYLVSSEAGYITGANLTIDGGFSA